MKLILPFHRDLNRGCLTYLLSLRFSVSKRKFFINLQQQFCVREIFRTQILRNLQSLHFLKKLPFGKCVTHVFVYSFVKTCSLTGC